MRILVTLNASVQELIDDLERLPTRYRSQRLKALAYSAVVGRAATSAPTPQMTAADIPTPNAQINVLDCNDSDLFDYDD